MRKHLIIIKKICIIFMTIYSFWLIYKRNLNLNILDWKALYLRNIVIIIILGFPFIEEVEEEIRKKIRIRRDLMMRVIMMMRVEKEEMGLVQRMGEVMMRISRSSRRDRVS